jgi:hypothetical protein
MVTGNSCTDARLAAAEFWVGVFDCPSRRVKPNPVNPNKTRLATFMKRWGRSIFFAGIFDLPPRQMIGRAG